MNPLIQHLRDFNRDYLDRRQQRRRLYQTLAAFLATLALIWLAGLLLWGLQR